MSPPLSELQDFDGVARLFPLPNLVVYPHVVQPLHIFEKRYRQMTADALASDRLFALALPKPGWEDDYEGRPPIHAGACLCHIFGDEKLPNGRYNLLVRGVGRITILEEIPSKKLYRSARVELLEPEDPSPEVAESLQRLLRAAALEWQPKETAAAQQFLELLDSDLELGVLADILAFALVDDAEFKQVLLESAAVAPRVRRLLDHLAGRRTPSPPSRTRFPPPDFSPN